MNIRQKQYHIVFGQIAKATFIESKCFDLSEIELICLKDGLNVGPLCDIFQDDFIKKRKDWISNTFAMPLILNQLLTAVDEDIESIKTLIPNAGNISNIFLWTGFDASEIIGTSRLLYHLSSFDREIFIANYPNIPLKSFHGEVIYPPTLYTTASEQVEEVAKHFKLLSKKEIESWTNLWEKSVSEKFAIRHLHSDGVISGESEAYFDTFLLSNCKNEFQSAARVIGKTLVDIEFDVRDSYLNWRLKKLVAMQLLESSGELAEIRDYKVKLIR
ncbi:hypothetical protein DSECCO2_110050 [anaerobic digester metagenome]|uniref:DUF3658 domain-containing protein n=1 Tax=Petrimonas sp. TaxID=2023866 RepID=UPI002FC9E1D9